ncbi:MAG: hypothetical protein J6T73_02475, partial [Clostridia bacterium]|nr:hypothetical protein [Clostridia bacterium]
MKSFKKTLSVLTALVMVLLLFSVIPVMQASAAAGDVWSISHSSTNWRYIASGLSYNIDTKMVTVPANTSIGTQKYILLTNNYSTPDNAISPNTTYRIKFDVSSQGKDISLYSARVGYAYNISPASGNNYHQSVSQISNLTSYSTLFE